MKKLIGLLVLIALSAQADDEYRTFTAADGRTLKAKVISYDDDTGKVKIQREDTKVLIVSTTAFSKEDQKYIKTWATTGAFLSESKFKLDIKRREVGSTKKEIEVDIGEEFAGGGRRGGGDSGVVVVAIDKKTEYKFDLLLENKSKTPLKNITVEYRIYYEQEKAIEDEKANKNRDDDDTRPKRHKALEESKVIDGKSRIREVEAGAEITESTQSVKILKRSANRTWGDNIDLDGDVHGVWIKLSMRAPNGKKLVREVAYPPSIPKKFPWDPPEEEPPAE